MEITCCVFSFFPGVDIAQMVDKPEIWDGPLHPQISVRNSSCFGLQAEFWECVQPISHDCWLKNTMFDMFDASHLNLMITP
jgi:hypothetical protein